MLHFSLLTKTAKYEHPFVQSQFQDEENQATLEHISENTQKQQLNLVPGKAYRAHGMFVCFLLSKPMSHSGTYNLPITV